MKRLIKITLLFILILSLVAGCGKKSELTVRYQMEQKLNEADRLRSDFQIKGPTFSDNDLQLLVDAYSAVINMIPQPKDSLAVLTASPDIKESWALAALATTRIGVLYKERGEYDQAFNYFARVAAGLATTTQQKVLVLGYMAFCKEKSLQFKPAAAWYDSLAALYLSNIDTVDVNYEALDAPINAAEMWQAMGDEKAFSDRMDQARAYYASLRQKYSGTKIDQAALGKIIATYLRQERYSDALKIIETTRNPVSRQLSPHLLVMVININLENLQNFRQAEAACREFIKAYPDDKNLGKVYLSLALSLFDQGKFAEARKITKDLENIPQASAGTLSESTYLAALCYEKEGSWERALNQFDLVQATFPGSDKAFEAGLYVANYYENKGQHKLATQSFNEAADYISRFINPTTSNPLLASRALGYLVKCYTEMKDYPKAVETLNLLHNRYPQLPEGKFAPLRLADLYENILRDNKKAAYWLKTFLQANPDVRDAEKINRHIADLESS